MRSGLYICSPRPTIEAALASDSPAEAAWDKASAYWTSGATILFAPAESTAFAWAARERQQVQRAHTLPDRRRLRLSDEARGHLRTQLADVKASVAALPKPLASGLHLFEGMQKVAQVGIIGVEGSAIQ